MTQLLLFLGLLLPTLSLASDFTEICPGIYWEDRLRDPTVENLTIEMDRIQAFAIVEVDVVFIGRQCQR